MGLPVERGGQQENLRRLGTRRHRGRSVPWSFGSRERDDDWGFVSGSETASLAFSEAEEQAVGLERVVPFLLSSKLAKRGADMQPADNWSAKVSVDGRLVTGQNPQSATGVGEAIRDLFLA